MKDSSTIIKDLRWLTYCSKRIDGPYIQTFLPPAASLKEQNWLDFRISILALQAISGAQQLISMLPLPNLPDSPEVKNTLIVLASKLDEYLSEFIDLNNILIKRNAKLADRINAVQNLISVKNAENLHRLRSLRNQLSHEQTSNKLSWVHVNEFTDIVELSLIDLRILSGSTDLELANTELSAVDVIEQYEKMKRELTISLNKKGVLHTQYKWIYHFNNANED